MNLAAAPMTTAVAPERSEGNQRLIA